VFGPEETPVDNLPGGIGVADITLAGRYVFRAEVVDAEGTRASADIEVTTEQLLMAYIVATPEFPAVGEVVEFSAETEFILPASADSMYQWDFGDGERNAGPSVTHAFLSPGEYTVSVLVAIDGTRAKSTVVVYVGDGVECEDACQHEAERAYMECLQRGKSGAECASHSRGALETCVEENCDTDFDCAEHCVAQVEEEVEECVAGGGTLEECAAAAYDSQDRCFEEQCGTDLLCEEGCDYLVQGVFIECMAAGDDEAVCDFFVDSIWQSCTQTQCGEEVDCAQDCEQTADRMFTECRRGGGSEAECANRGRQYLETCMTDDCDIEPMCDELCASQAGAVYSECMRSGGDPDECADSYDAFLENCLYEECDTELITMYSCEELCVEESDEVFYTCLDEGESEDVCGPRADEAYEACMMEGCDGGDFERDQMCQVGCFDEADAAYFSCLDSGLTELECISEFEATLDVCLAENCGEEDEGVATCEEECQAMADAAWDECYELGGDDATCDEQWAEMVDTCISDNCTGL
jgi:hypothetical protein